MRDLTLSKPNLENFVLFCLLPSFFLTGGVEEKNIEARNSRMTYYMVRNFTHNKGLEIGKEGD